MKFILVSILLISLTIVAGYAAQEESGICLPERHAADQADAKFCHCLDMGGYKFCKDGVWQFKDWAAAGTPTPQCEMSCKEENCKCCKWQDDYDKTHKRVAITIPYDKY